MENFHFTKIRGCGIEKGLEVRKNGYRRHFCKSSSDIGKLIYNGKKSVKIQNMLRLFKMKEILR